ncbi:MAG: LamG domain-containing protein, partial [Planctomycetota bacterium]|nr:LamG domain-containing protein [Planctomycetota bacterium]
WVKRKPSPGSSAVLMRSSDGAIKLDQWPSTNKVGITIWGVVDATFDVKAPLQTWMHLAFVGSASGTDLYADGLYADSVPYALRAPTGPIGGLGDALNAVVDDVRVYDRTLSASEIFDLAQ